MSGRVCLLDAKLDLELLYSADQLPHQRQRYARLLQKFAELYGEQAEFVARAPGRVNLIGEHIDYCGFCVLPMAIEKDVVIVGRAHRRTRASALVRVHNSDESRFAAFDVDCNELLANDASFGGQGWRSFFLGGFKSALSQVSSSDVAALNDANLLVDGEVPLGSGLSSSSALVCATFLAGLRINDVRTLSPERAAELAAAGERLCGINCGGMDQAASFLGERGCAKLISFGPLRAVSVPLPPNAVFVIANSLVTSEKAVTAKVNYNRRVLECRMASMLLLNDARFTPQHGSIVRDALRRVCDRSAEPVAAASSLRAVRAALDERLSDSRATLSVNGVLDLLSPASEHDALARDALDVDRKSIDVDVPLPVRKRLQHVIDEAERVIRFAAISASKVGTVGLDNAGRCELKANDNATSMPMSDSERVAALGQLMNESHTR